MEMLQEIFYKNVLPNSAAGTVFILLILLFRKMTERLSKGFVRILWVLLLAELLAPPLLYGPQYTMRNLAGKVQGMETGKKVPQGNAQGKPPASMQTEQIPQPDAGAEAAGVQKNEGTFPRAGQGTLLKGLFQEIEMKAVFPAVWLAGTVCLCVVYLCQLYALRKKVSDAVFLPEDGCWVTRRVNTAFVMPYIRPRIYLPQKLSGSGRADILAHERQHIKNADPLLKCLAVFAAAVHWFHPLVWAACLYMGKDLEMYCDECVLRGKSMEERRRYSNTLLESASVQGGPPLTARFGGSNTEHRIRHILYTKKPRLAVTLFLSALVGAGDIFFLTAKNVEEKKDIDMAGQDAQKLLAEKILAQSGGPLLQKYYADFDGDGERELFVVTGAAVSEGTSQIWYAGSGEVTCLMDDSEGYTVLWEDEKCIHTVDSRQKLFVVTCGTMGSSMFSKCYYVKDKKAQEADTGAYLEQLDGRDFAAYLDAYDREYLDGSWSGHTKKAYYLKWTGSGFEELVHVLSGWERSRYFLCENGMLAHEGSGSAFDGVKSYVTLKGAALQLEESVIWDYDRRRDARVYYYSAESEYDTKQASEITEEQAEAVMQKHAYERPVFMPFAS